MGTKTLLLGVNPTGMIAKAELTEIRFLLDHNALWANLTAIPELGKRQLQTVLRCLFSRCADIFQDALFKFAIQAVKKTPITDKRLEMCISPEDLAAVRASKNPHVELVQHLITTLSYAQRTLRSYCRNLGFNISSEVDTLCQVRNRLVHCAGRADSDLLRALKKHRACQSMPGITDDQIRLSVGQAYAAVTAFEQAITQIEDTLHRAFGVRWTRLPAAKIGTISPAIWYKRIGE